VQTISEIGTTGVVKLPSTAGAFPTHNGNGSTRGDGAGVIKRGIDLLRRPELNSRLHLPKPARPAEDRSREVNAFVVSLALVF
jgi:hypothetical protein